MLCPSIEWIFKLKSYWETYKVEKYFITYYAESVQSKQCVYNKRSIY